MSGGLVVFLLLGLLGIAFVLIGTLIWRKDKIELLHYYHYKFVNEKERKFYTKIVGETYMLLGILFVFSAIIFLFWRYSWIISASGFVIFLTRMAYIQRRYNKPSNSEGG